MRPPETFMGQPIRDLQTMLRVIVKAGKGETPLIPDGIYSQNTARAVADFQRDHGLPATGVTDSETWEAVCCAYRPARVELCPACPLHIPLDPGQTLKPGEEHAHLYLVQGILAVVCSCYGLPAPGFTGTLDPKTEQALVAFQRLCRLPATGILDKMTWKHLALHYPLAALLSERRRRGETV